MVILREAQDPAEVLLIHAPYPGRLKFQGVPSSMLAAIGPFTQANGGNGVRYLDPRGPSPAFYRQVASHLKSGKVRAMCISTSTAAIGETTRLAALAANVAPEVLVVAGGPHEDSVDQKVAERVRGVHVSISGEAETALQILLEDFLGGGQCAEAFVAELSPFTFANRGGGGRFTVACCRWDKPHSFNFGPGRFSDPRPLVFPERYPKFDIFEAASTIPLMVSRGCPYGKCTFCAEAIRPGGVTQTRDCSWVKDLAIQHPKAALYFQDSIFPASMDASGDLLPMLRGLGREWGCQVYLPMLTERRVAELADHGCTYLYTGVESGSPDVMEGISKSRGTGDLALQRMQWIRDHGMRAGISLMFGAMATDGRVLETGRSLRSTSELIDAVFSTGVEVAGVYPNVQTVLPGTALARGLAANGHDLNFYSMPRAPIFDGLEDGGVGYNFLTMGKPSEQESALAEQIVSTVEDLQLVSGRAW